MQPFSCEELRLRGAFLIKPLYVTDKRGGFIKDYNIDTFREFGLDYPLKEVFYTISKKGVIRAIHFQLGKPQPKLVRCVSGHVYDVIVDLRPTSPTYGEWQGFHLYGEQPEELYIPGGFGHGYLVLEDSIVSYKCGEVFYSAGDSGIMWNDAELAVKWPLEAVGGASNLIISEKDLRLMDFSEYDKLMGERQ